MMGQERAGVPTNRIYDAVAGSARQFGIGEKGKQGNARCYSHNSAIE